MTYMEADNYMHVCMHWEYACDVLLHVTDGILAYSSVRMVYA